MLLLITLFVIVIILIILLWYFDLGKHVVALANLDSVEGIWHHEIDITTPWKKYPDLGKDEVALPNLDSMEGIWHHEIDTTTPLINYESIGFQLRFWHLASIFWKHLWFDPYAGLEANDASYSDSFVRQPIFEESCDQPQPASAFRKHSKTTNVGFLRSYFWKSLFANTLLLLLISSGIWTPYEQKTAINSTTRLTKEEVNRMSPMIAADWSSLAGLLNIPYYKQEEIRFNHTEYPSLTSKAEQIFTLYNASKAFSRAALKKHFKELGRHDVGCQMLRFENEAFPTESRSLKSTQPHGSYQASVTVDLASPTSFHNDVAEEEDPILMSRINKQRSKTVSKRPDLVKKLITVDGGVMEIDGITLKFGPGCLAQDTEITLMKDDRNLAFKSLHKLGLISAIPRVIECLPDGLKFLKPAWLTVRFETKISDEELFTLHGSYNRDFQKIIWKLVPNDVEEKKVDGAVNVQINEFCFYCFISASRNMIARVLSHLNQSFTCRAYSLYRRLGTSDMIDISVVLISEFLDDNNEEDIKQLKDHYEEGYTKGERGMLKRVDTDRRFEMFLDFPGVESTSVSFKVDQPQLDSVGFVIDDFKEISVKHPANGRVKVHEVPPTENRLLWNLSVREVETVITWQQVQLVESTEPDDEPSVVYRTTRLTNREISRMSTMVGVEWNGLAGLMNIPYSEREEIRMNHTKYPDSFSKAEKVFSLFNDREDFCRGALEKCVKELNLHDVKKEMLNVDENEESHQSPPPDCPNEKDVLENTPLSPREMWRLSRKISVSESYKLAGIMGISNEERQNIRSNPIYTDGCSWAEKFLSMFNRNKNFSRKALGDCLSEIQKLDLVEPIMTGQWRSL